MKDYIKESLKEIKGITLIALVITIIVLLILARNKYFNIKWRKWITTKSRKIKRRYSNWPRKRASKTFIFICSYEQSQWKCFKKRYSRTIR